MDVFASSHGHEKDQPNNTRDTTPGVDWISVNQLRVESGGRGIVQHLRPPMWKIRAEILLINKGVDCGQAVKILNRILITCSCRIRMATKRLEMTA